jgi:hypothetical protein
MKIIGPESSDKKTKKTVDKKNVKSNLESSDEETKKKH